MGAALECDVLVSGLGPVGATLTALLAQSGASTIAIDKETEPYALPRAVHFDHEIMRLFQQLGVAEAVRRHTRDLPAYEFRAAGGELLMRMPPPAETPSGWGAGYMFHQPGLEGVLRDALAKAPNADLRLGWELEGFEQDTDGVTASVATPQGPRVIRSRYLIGCDGAWSPVREAIGGGLFDYRFDEPWLVVDAKVDSDSRVPEVNLQLCDPARPTTCVLGGPGRHRWEFMMLPGETAEAMLDDAVIQRLIEPWECGPIEIERRAVYRFHGLVANRWRSGRVLIAGDAAHQTPPFAGQGMCAGLRDVANLAWKLEAVLSGVAEEALLDSYQREREPHVRAMIELAIGMGRVVCTLDPEAAASRDAHMLAVREAGGSPLPSPGVARFEDGCILAGAPGAGTMFPQPTSGQGPGRLRMDDVLGGGAWLLTRAPHGSTPVRGLREFSLETDELSPFRASVETWLDRQGAEAVLIRPDRYVFGAGDPETLASAWSQVLSPLRLAA